MKNFYAIAFALLLPAAAVPGAGAQDDLAAKKYDLESSSFTRKMDAIKSLDEVKKIAGRKAKKSQ